MTRLVNVNVTMKTKASDYALVASNARDAICRSGKRSSVTMSCIVKAMNGQWTGAVDE